MTVNTPRPPRVLFVEDDVGKRYVIARQLRAAGFVVDECETGAQGLERVTPEHDVAILDLKLPDMHGFDLCRRIKDNPATTGVKVLELSATLASAEDRARGLDGGADNYLVHPVEIIELVAALRALVRMRDLERERARAMDLFIAALGHDLRNPLATVVTGLEVLDARESIQGLERSTVERSLRATDRMRRMIDQLLAFTQTLAGKEVPFARQRVPVAPLVRAAAADLEAEVAIEGDDGAAWSGDPDRLRRVVDNLIGNAHKHGAGGTIHATIGPAAQAGRTQLAVHNGGEPIASALLATLFDPFVRAGKREGFGLGLFIVQQIVGRHDGTVDVVSSADAGTTFTVAIPSAQ